MPDRLSRDHDKGLQHQYYSLYKKNPVAECLWNISVFLFMNHVHTRPQLTEDLKFNKNCHILIFIWRDVISAVATAPRQGFCPRPCSCHPPSGPLHLPASCSIPSQLSAQPLPLPQPASFSAPLADSLLSCTSLPGFPGNLPDTGARLSASHWLPGSYFPSHLSDSITGLVLI